MAFKSYTVVLLFLNQPIACAKKMENVRGCAVYNIICAPFKLNRATFPVEKTLTRHRPCGTYTYKYGSINKTNEINAAPFRIPPATVATCVRTSPSAHIVVITRYPISCGVHRMFFCVPATRGGGGISSSLTPPRHSTTTYI